jgi:hypothetical protein
VVGSDMLFGHLSHVFDGLCEHFPFFLSLLLNFFVVLGLWFGMTVEENFVYDWGEVINHDYKS